MLAKGIYCEVLYDNLHLCWRAGLLFSVLVTAVITDAMKDAVGRPRPDFFYRCFPDGKEVWSHLSPNSFVFLLLLNANCFPKIIQTLLYLYWYHMSHSPKSKFGKTSLRNWTKQTPIVRTGHPPPSFFCSFLSFS